MKGRHKSNDFDEEVSFPKCYWDGCLSVGEYPAPKSRAELEDYQWLCIDHIKKYNNSWDFLKGLSEAEIHEFQINAMNGHRPTWKMGVNPKVIQRDFADEALREFGGYGNWSEHDNVPQLPRDEKRALSTMELSLPITKEEIKRKYKQLVKIYHPDVNGNDKVAEEKFKSISEAYRLLMNSSLFQ